MDAPPIPRLVDLVHVFKGVVVEQFKKRLEKLLSNSIPLWRLLKLLFKILQKWICCCLLADVIKTFLKTTIRDHRFYPLYSYNMRSYTWQSIEIILKLDWITIMLNSYCCY